MNKPGTFLALAISTAACTPTRSPITVDIPSILHHEIPSAEPEPKMAKPEKAYQKPATTGYEISRCIEAKLGSNAVESVHLECKAQSDYAETCRDQVANEVINKHADKNTANFIPDCATYIDILNAEGVEDPISLIRCEHKIESNFPGEIAQHQKDLSKRISACLESTNQCYRQFALKHQLSCVRSDY